MAVYVDDVQLPFGQMIMCHMWADTEQELLAMADRIGVARKWIQGHPTLSTGKAKRAGWLHFDISRGKKAAAINAGARLTDKYGPSEHVAKLEGNQKMLDKIAECRKLRTEPDRSGEMSL